MTDEQKFEISTVLLKEIFSEFAHSESDRAEKAMDQLLRMKEKVKEAVEQVEALERLGA